VPNQSDIAGLEGLAALLENSGESVVYRGVSVTVLVDRDLPLDILSRMEFDRHARDMSEVWFPASSLTHEPKVGESMQDQFERHHRIRAVRRNGMVYKCSCEVSDPH
jgi:hypothetical protein